MTGSAKQSTWHQRSVDCFVAFAPRNDDTSPKAPPNASSQQNIENNPMQSSRPRRRRNDGDKAASRDKIMFCRKDGGIRYAIPPYKTANCLLRRSVTSII